MEVLAALAFTGLELLALCTAQWLIRLLSRGRWQSEALNSDRYRIHSSAGALSYRLDGRRIVTVEGQWIVGLLFYGALAGVGIWWLLTTYV